MEIRIPRYVKKGTLLHTGAPENSGNDADPLSLVAVSSVRTSHSLAPKTDNCLLLNICLRKEFFRKILRHTIRKRSAMNGLILRRSENRLKYIFYPLIQNRQFQVLLSSVLQTYSAGRFRETPELERLFIRMFDELSATDEYSLTGPDEETLRLISALHARSLCPLEDIASEAGLTAGYISGHIKEYCGREAGTILREERMKHAAELLANKTTNLYHIAAECGYENITAFADDFRYYYGTSPEEYREQLI